jgi:superfamily II DNA helicase RecQ
MARLDANKFETPTPVQAGCIPPALEGRDVLATAQTGTGKTLGYLIPIVESLQKDEGRGALALIVLPTRELAMQVEDAFKTIRPNSRQSVALVVGGMNERPQLDAIRRGARLKITSSASWCGSTKSKCWCWTRLTGCSIWASSQPLHGSRPRCRPCIRRFATRRPSRARSKRWRINI